jgi:hypothetical protein
MISDRMRHLRLVHSLPISRTPEGEPSHPEGGCATVERDGRPFDPALQGLLEHVRVIGPLPRTVRERALARARAVLATHACAPARPPPRHRRPWLTLLVSLTLAAAVGAAVETLLARRAAGTDQPSHAAAPLRIAAD